MLVQIDILPTGGAYVDTDAVVAIVPRHDETGCTIFLDGGHKVIFPGDIHQAYSQLFHRE
jgi:ectoine hydroxylase-related dioxygenase (phytanoyl-CoA dioxygenase family)